jgi:hypothetical protein
MPTHAHRLGLLAVLAYCGCSDPADDTELCPSSDGEFALAGCAVLAGQVLDTSGLPLTDISVSFRALRPCGCTEFGSDVDAQGRFRYTINRFMEDPAGDTLTVKVRAAATGEQYPQPTPTTFIRDSVDAVLTFTPVGAFPNTTTVELRLEIP